MTTRKPKKKEKLPPGVIAYMNGIPVKEALADIYLMPNQVDIKNAKPYDAENCVFSKCAQRNYGGIATIRGSTAYIQMLDEKGNPVIYRFKIYDKQTRAYIDKNDTGKKLVPGSFRLSAPIPAHTLKAQKQYEKEWSKRRREELLKLSKPRKGDTRGAKNRRNSTPESKERRKILNKRRHTKGKTVKTYLRSQLSVLKLSRAA